MLDAEDNTRAPREARRAWLTWLTIGCTGFGGPAGQVALIHREIVERKRWLDEEEFLAALRVCMLLPGPEAQQLATYVGWRRGGAWGGLIAGTLFVLPGALLVTALAWLHAAGRDAPVVAAAFAGTRPAVVALVGVAAWRIGRKSLTSPAAVVLAVAAGAALAGGVPFPLVVLAAGAIGWMTPRRVGGDRGVDGGVGPDRPGVAGWGVVPRHAATVVGLCVMVWLVCYGIVVGAHAAGGRGPAIALLFTETTLLSLGGAYAVVPWALDESVARGWIEPGERFAALALGETTPGPLILVVTFIGFLAGWRADPADAATAGLAGAATATAFAFIPAFGLVLTVAPAVRSIRAGSGLARVLTGVGAAVVAAITTLAGKLTAAALIDAGRVDVVSVLIASLAAVCLALGRLPTPVVVLAAAAAGVVRGAP